MYRLCVRTKFACTFAMVKNALESDEQKQNERENSTDESIRGEIFEHSKRLDIGGRVLFSLRLQFNTNDTIQCTPCLLLSYEARQVE